MMTPNVDFAKIGILVGIFILSFFLGYVISHDAAVTQAHNYANAVIVKYCSQGFYDDNMESINSYGMNLTNNFSVLKRDSHEAE